MKHVILSLLLLVFGSKAYSQNTFQAVIKDGATQSVLPGASVTLGETNIGAVSDSQGFVRLNEIPDGKNVFVFRYVGYYERADTLTFPLPEAKTFEIVLMPVVREMEEVIITTTRSSRSIENIPTRVEFIGGEELEEKITMQPGNIRMILSESTGIQTQQTSVSSANSTIRIQGLDGRYTQILKDGFPLYSGFSGGLSIMQIPPLDLKQADVIKGSASTLYGGGAIAGLINLISRQPEEEPELSFLVNGSSARGFDASAYYAKRSEKIGLTFFGSHNYNKAYDPAGIGFSAIPEYKRYTANPRLFLYYGQHNKVVLGINAAFEDRLGGDMQVIDGNKDASHSFFEGNKTNRVSTQLSVNHRLKKGLLSLKNSLNVFKRDIEQPDYFFAGKQVSSFSEITYEQSSTRSEWVVGGNLLTDGFSEERYSAFAARDYKSVTGGLFVQNTFTATDWLSVESGLRVDNAHLSSSETGSLNDLFLLPRISMLFRLTKNITSRIGGGLGYKTPTIFTEKAEEQVFKNVRPISFDNTRSETSSGVNADLNVKFPAGDDWTLELNQLFFYTNIQRPLIFNSDSLENEVFYFENADGHIDAAGTETNIKIGYSDYKLFFGYTFVNAQNHFKGMRTDVPLTAKHRINAMLIYEVEEKWRVGFESFYYGSQHLSDGAKTTDYWMLGFSAQRMWQHFSLFVNFENFTDTRQTRFGPIFTGPTTDPEFSELYAPLDGFLFNAGFILKF
jgi:outer membrane receptor for ferrienterochelin and colicins